MEFRWTKAVKDLLKDENNLCARIYAVIDIALTYIPEIEEGLSKDFVLLEEQDDSLAASIIGELEDIRTRLEHAYYSDLYFGENVELERLETLTLLLRLKSVLEYINSNFVPEITLEKAK